MLKLRCATKCSNNHKYPQIHSQDSLHFSITLAVLRGASSDSLDPLVVSFDSSDPLGVGSGSHDPLGAGSISLDPLVAGSVSPDPLVVASSRPTSWVQCPLRTRAIYTFPFPRQRLSARYSDRWGLGVYIYLSPSFPTVRNQLALFFLTSARPK